MTLLVIVSYLTVKYLFDAPQEVFLKVSPLPSSPSARIDFATFLMMTKQMEFKKRSQSARKKRLARSKPKTNKGASPLTPQKTQTEP
jgi:hypothetical protein